MNYNALFIGPNPASPASYNPNAMRQIIVQSLIMIFANASRIKASAAKIWVLDNSNSRFFQEVAVTLKRSGVKSVPYSVIALPTMEEFINLQSRELNGEPLQIFSLNHGVMPPFTASNQATNSRYRITPSFKSFDLDIKRADNDYQTQKSMDYLSSWTDLNGLWRMLTNNGNDHPTLPPKDSNVETDYTPPPRHRTIPLTVNIKTAGGNKSYKVHWPF